jgi:hypothetical protein
LSDSSSASARTGVLVLGMHRSGTSALTRIVNLLGLPLGGPLMPPHPGNNETGFWELAPAVAIDQRLLDLAGVEWDSPGSLPAAWLERVPQSLFDEAIALTAANFADVPAFAIKDPRICRLWPFWLRVFAAAGVRPVAVHLIRSPAEVAASLMQRDRISAERCAALWIAHTLEAEAMPGDRLLLRYDRLLADPQAASRNLIEWLAQEDVPAQPADAEISAFLQPALRHHRDLSRLNGEMGALAEQLYAALCGVAGTRDPLETAYRAGIESRFSEWLRSRARWHAPDAADPAAVPARWGALRALLFRLGMHAPAIRHVAHHDLAVEDAVTYHATGVDPWFTLLPDGLTPPWRWPRGWYAVELEGAWSEAPLAPKLYVDYGSGFSEDTAIELVDDAGIGAPVFVKVHHEIAEIRIDPVDRPLRFRLAAVHLRRVPALLMAWRFAIALVSRRRSPGGLEGGALRLLYQRWRAEGLAGLLPLLERDIDIGGRVYGWRPLDAMVPPPAADSRALSPPGRSVS